MLNISIIKYIIADLVGAGRPPPPPPHTPLQFSRKCFVVKMLNSKQKSVNLLIGNHFPVVYPRVLVS